MMDELELQSLEESLAHYVRMEDYEQAAVCRDHIAALKAHLQVKALGVPLEEEFRGVLHGRMYDASPVKSAKWGVDGNGDPLPPKTYPLLPLDPDRFRNRILEKSMEEIRERLAHAIAQAVEQMFSELEGGRPPQRVIDENGFVVTTFKTEEGISYQQVEYHWRGRKVIEIRSSPEKYQVIALWRNS